MGLFKDIFKGIAVAALTAVGLALANPQLTLLSLQTLKIFGVGATLNLGLLAYSKLSEPDSLGALDFDTSRTIFSSRQPARFVFGRARVNGLLINISNTEDTLQIPTDILREVVDRGRGILNQAETDRIDDILDEEKNDVVYASFVIATHSVESIQKIFLNSNEIVLTDELKGSGYTSGRGDYDGLLSVGYRLNVNDPIPQRIINESDEIGWVFRVRIRTVNGRFSTNLIYTDRIEEHTYRLFLNKETPQNDSQEELDRIYNSGNYAIQHTLEYHALRRTTLNGAPFGVARRGFSDTFTGLETGEYGADHLSFGFLPSKNTEANGLALVTFRLLADSDVKRRRWRDLGGLSNIQRVQFEVEGMNDIITEFQPTGNDTYTLTRGYTDNPIAIAHHLVTEVFKIFDRTDINIPRLIDAINVCNQQGYTANGFGDYRRLNSLLISILNQARGQMSKDGGISFYSYPPNAPADFVLKTSDFGEIRNFVLESDVEFANKGFARYRDDNDNFEFKTSATYNHPTYDADAISASKDFGTLEAVINKEEARKTILYLLNQIIYSKSFEADIPTAKLQEIQETIDKNNMMINNQNMMINGEDVTTTTTTRKVASEFNVGTIVEIQDDLGIFDGIDGKYRLTGGNYRQTKALTATFTDHRDEIFEGV